MIHYVSMTCFTEAKHQIRPFNIKFAVANIKYSILGAPFFKKSIQNIDFHQNNMTYKEQHPKLPTKHIFRHLQKRNTHIIHTFILLNVKNQFTSSQDQERLYTSKIKNYLNLHFELEDNTQFYPSIPYTYFLQIFNDVFHFLDMVVNDKIKYSCSTVIQNFTSHPATLPRGIIGYIEIPIAQTTTPHYRVYDVNSLIHSVIHAYHPDTTIPNRQNDYTDMNLCTRVIPQSLLKSTKKK